MAIIMVFKELPSHINEFQIKMYKVSSNMVSTGPGREKKVLDCKERVFLKNFLYAVSTDSVQSLVPDVILPLPLLGGGFAACCFHT